MSLGVLPALGRRAIAVTGALAIVAVASISVIKAQQVPAPPPPDQFKYDVPQTLVFWTIKQPAVDSFEQVLKGVKDALAKSDKPERKAQAAHWKVYKSAQADGSAIYIFNLDQINKDVSYNPFAILNEGGMKNEDVKALLDKINPNVQIAQVNYTPFIDMASGGGH